MLRQIIFCAVVVLASTGVAGSVAAKADGLDPIAVRQAVMSLQGGDFAYIRAVLAAKAMSNLWRFPPRRSSNRPR